MCLDTDIGMPINDQNVSKAPSEVREMNENDTPLTYEQASELLSAPSGHRPRIYGTLPGGHECAGQIVAIRSQHYLDLYDCDRIWLSGTTVADLVGRA